MATNTHISWADTTWPITVGCDKASAGCASCYAMKDARRMESNPNPKIHTVYSNLVVKTGGGSLDWTGTIKTLPERLDYPRTWSGHRLVFVCSQSDLFHPDVPADFIARAFDTMHQYNQHRYLILTKRPERVLELMHTDKAANLKDVNRKHFPHIRFGVSAEDQANADRRIPLLVQMDIDNFVSLEPLIGPIDLSTWICSETPKVQWVITGGESGKYARPMHPKWVIHLRDQCAENNVLFHFKQWGEWVTEQPEKKVVTLQKHNTTFYRVGRRRTGRLLEGTLYDARPAEATNDETL